MKKLLIAAALVGAGSLFLSDVSTGHGGTYRGPGDTVPPGGGGGGGGGGPAGPGAGGPSGPAGPGGPSSPGPGGPSTPGAAPSAGGGSPTTGGGDTGPDLTVWSFWWEFNKDPYLNLRETIQSTSVETGSDEFFLGHGSKASARDNLAPTEEQIRTTIVPALKRALENETNNDIVTGSLIALAKIGDVKSEDGESEFQGIITPFLRDGNQEIRETAALALGILANPESIPLLIDLLKDSPAGRKVMAKTEVNYRTRAFAAYGLALVGAKSQSAERAQVVDALVETLDSGNFPTRDIPVSCLLALGLVPVTEIAAVPVEEGSDTVAPASSSRTAQIEYLLAYFLDDSNNYMNRAHAPTSMVRLMRDLPTEELDTFKARVAPILLEAISKRSKEERQIQQSCVLAIGEICDDDKDELDVVMRKALVGVSSNISDQQTRNYSMIALGQAAGHPGAGLDSGASGAGVKEIQKHLLKTLAKGKSNLRPWTALGIGVWGELLNKNDQSLPADVVMALRSAMIDEGNPDRFGAYAIACGIVKDLDSQEALLKKLESMRTNEARGYACVALGLMNAGGAKEAIETVVRESQYRPDLLKQAATALGLLGDKELVGEMVKMLRESRGLATQAALSNALGFIGDTNSVNPLVEMLQNDQITATARGFAAVALGIVAEKQPLPWNSVIAFGVNYRASTRTLNDTEGTGILNIL